MTLVLDTSDVANLVSVRDLTTRSIVFKRQSEGQRSKHELKIIIDEEGKKKCYALLIALQPWLEIGIAPSRGSGGLSWTNSQSAGSNLWGSKQKIPGDLSRRAAEDGKKEDGNGSNNNNNDGAGGSDGGEDNNLALQQCYPPTDSEERARVILGLRAFQAITDFKREPIEHGQAIILRLSLLSSGSILPSLQSIFEGDGLSLDAITGEEAARLGLEVRVPGDEFVVACRCGSDGERFEYILLSKVRRAV